LCHRLQRARRTRSFDNVTDADIARRIAEEAGLTQLDITPTRTVHEHVLQCNQSDWEFLGGRAAEIGFEVGMDGGRFHFSPVASVWAGAAAAPADRAVPGGLRGSDPRVGPGTLPADVEVGVWAPLRGPPAAAPPAPTRAAGVSAPRTGGLADVAGRFRPEGGG